jgi:hypothetical protein
LKKLLFILLLGATAYGQGGRLVFKSYVDSIAGVKADRLTTINGHPISSSFNLAPSDLTADATHRWWTDALGTTLTGKLNIADTAAMFSAHPGGVFDTTGKFINYQNAINARATTSALTSGLSGKQNTITTGSTSQYFRGDLSLATFPILANTASIDSATLHAQILAAINARATVSSVSGKEPAVTGTSSTDYYRGDKTFQPLNKAAVGLGNVINTDTVRADIATAINARLKISDTAAMQGPYQNALNVRSSIGHTHSESDVSNLVSDLAGKAATSHTHAESDVTNLISDLGLKAPLASPTFTGSPVLPTGATAVTQSPGNFSTAVATTAYTDTRKRSTVPNINYTQVVSDYLIAFTSLTATRVVTLAAATTASGRHYVIKDEAGTAGTNNITISGTINGTANPTAINTNYGVYRFYSNGTAWFSE